MPPATRIASHPIISPLFGALLMVLTVPLKSAVAEEQEETDKKQAPQSTAPIRTGDYVDDYAELNAMREGVIILPSGVQYEILKSGSGKLPGATDTVIVNYRAMLSNGVEFDNTYERGEPAALALNEYLLPGLKEALLLMKEGDEWRVTIPAKLGFRGSRLLRKRDLIYEITLLAVVAPVDAGNNQPAPQ